MLDESECLFREGLCEKYFARDPHLLGMYLVTDGRAWVVRTWGGGWRQGRQQELKSKWSEEMGRMGGNSLRGET